MAEDMNTGILEVLPNHNVGKILDGLEVPWVTQLNPARPVTETRMGRGFSMSVGRHLNFRRVQRFRCPTTDCSSKMAVMNKSRMIRHLLTHLRGKLVHRNCGQTFFNLHSAYRK